MAHVTSNHYQLNSLSSLSLEELALYATPYIIQAKQAGFSFEQLMKEADEVHPAAGYVVKFVFAHH
ncbi:hypothetical protein [Aeromonas caviae]|uniref:hypothetical protein n=1 Tax=Aeromonas caviae TaxID=648 RepID=UPI0012FBAC66|nr:hypothetical protein [Aeromonas caviae]